MKKILISIIITPILAAFIASGDTFAVDACLDNEALSGSNIVFYKPNCLSFSAYNGAEITYDDLDMSGSWWPRADLMIKTYAPLAMELQAEYGLPWEVVFAQMAHESEIGKTGVASSIWKKDKKYNFLGLTASGPNSPGYLATGVYTSVGSDGKTRYFNEYDRLSDMIIAWVIAYGRNGRYDDAIAYLDPNDYKLSDFLYTFISVYAPSSDGNKPAAYSTSVMAYLGENGGIGSATKKYGYPTSEELARSKNIQPGGNWPQLNHQGIVPSIKEKYADTRGLSPSSNLVTNETNSNVVVAPVKPIEAITNDTSNVPCAEGTEFYKDYDNAHKGGNRVKIKLCKIKNIRQGSDYAIVSSTVSGAFQTLAERMRTKYGWTMTASSSFRSYEDQVRLYNCYINQNCNNGNLASQPGTSLHESGLAIDFNISNDGENKTGDHPENFKCASTSAWPSVTDKNGTNGNRWFKQQSLWLCENLSDFGLYRNVSNEVWHVAPRGA